MGQVIRFSHSFEKRKQQAMEDDKFSKSILRIIDYEIARELNMDYDEYVSLNEKILNSSNSEDKETLDEILLKVIEKILQDPELDISDDIIEIRVLYSKYN
jgi:hypothetical protein